MVSSDSLGGLDCNFLAINIGSLPLSKIQQHLRDCKECQEYLDDVYQGYRYHYGHETDTAPTVFHGGWTSVITDFSVIPDGIDRESFLSRWHLTVAKKMEETEFHELRLLEKMFSSVQGFYLLRNLVRHQHCALKFLASDTPKDVIAETNIMATLQNDYHRLKEFLGGPELSLFLHLEDPEQLGLIIEGWRRALFGTEQIAP